MAIPIAANPSPIRGRNLAWRRLIIEATTNDPEYGGGDYARQPHGYVATLPLFQLMIDSTAHLQRALPDIKLTTDFVHGDFGSGHPPADANDAIYALDASRDYDPSSALETIRSNVLAIQFADDEIIVPALGYRARPRSARWSARAASPWLSSSVAACAKAVSVPPREVVHAVAVGLPIAGVLRVETLYKEIAHHQVGLYGCGGVAQRCGEHVVVQYVCEGGVR